MVVSFSTPTLAFSVGILPMIGLHPSTLDMLHCPHPGFQFDSLNSLSPLYITMSQNPASSSTKSPEDRYILVTGSTGFIGAHVVDNLLARGYRVRGATRSAQKGEQMKDARPHYASKLDFVVVEDFTKTGVFDSAMDGIDGVIHVASVRTSMTRKMRTHTLINHSHSFITPQTTSKNSFSPP
jgi:NADPH:quinone reductase-like Zn-dependent oxidoreductase